MSDTIGVIGQKYEDRKSKKVGTLLDRDAENKKLHFLDDNAEPFQVSYAAFKSNWRKVIAETPAEPVVEPIAEEPVEEVEAEPEYNSSYENVTEASPDTKPEVKPLSKEDFATEDDKIKDFVKALTEARVASVDIIADDVTIMADDVIICTMQKVENGYKMFMLPDIFIFSDLRNTFSARDVHFNIKHGRHSGVIIDCVKASLGDILQFIKAAAVEINLYGYID
jgi:hypothetical protein